MLSVRTLNELRPVLLDPNADGPEDVYYMIRGNPNITVWVPGRIGKEYTKTLGHYHLHNEPETYRVLFGQAVFVLQKRGGDNPNELGDVHVIRAQAGDTVKIPRGYGHSASNVGETSLITIDNAPSSAEATVNDYEPIKKMGGFAYFVVEGKDGEVSLVKNPTYSKAPTSELPESVTLAEGPSHSINAN